MIGEPRQMRITHWDGPLPGCGEFLRAPSGTTYLVIAFTPTNRPPAVRKSVGRVDMVRLATDEQPPAGALIHHFEWNSRKRKQR